MAQTNQILEDNDKAIRHWKLAAMGGHEYARYNIGGFEYENGHIDRAMKHFMIAARCGYNKALEAVGEGYKDGHVTKDEYANILRACRDSQDEMKSERREKSRDWVREIRSQAMMS